MVNELVAEFYISYISKQLIAKRLCFNLKLGSLRASTKVLQFNIAELHPAIYRHFHTLYMGPNNEQGNLLVVFLMAKKTVSS